jgi:hypothetical protein
MLRMIFPLVLHPWKGESATVLGSPDIGKFSLHLTLFSFLLPWVTDAIIYPLLNLSGIDLEGWSGGTPA